MPEAFYYSTANGFFIPGGGGPVSYTDFHMTSTGHPGPGYDIRAIVRGTATVGREAFTSHYEFDLEIVPEFGGTGSAPATHINATYPPGSHILNFAASATFRSEDVVASFTHISFGPKFSYAGDHLEISLVDYSLVAVFSPRSGGTGTINLPYRWTELARRWVPEPSPEQTEAFLMLELNMRSLEDYLRTGHVQ